VNPTNGALAGLGPEELRAAVRAVLAEVLPAGTVVDGATPSGDVVIATDADLTAFVRRVAALCEDPQVRAALQDGRHGFRLAADARGLEARMPAHRPASVVRVDRGAVTERVVQKAAADGTRLLLGRRAVLTPLARDKARALGVEIEKER
jgi:hypothetical protein